LEVALRKLINNRHSERRGNNTGDFPKRQKSASARSKRSG
jgi:hypothetical protein